MNYNDIVQLCFQMYESMGTDIPSRADIMLAVKVTEEKMKNFINDEVPSGLKYAWAQMAVGKTLYDRLGGELLNGEEAENAEKDVKQITEGDISVTYMTANECGTGEMNDRRAEFIEAYLHPDVRLLMRYRRLCF